ncbi:MAG: alpha/beta fold hydrolase [Bacteroidetes bacterium]|jgi:pimeloyl-ACP methyl ester carboxylesterase|nr:alpha/beta fold hydrolase [Bacteroidota bacterium]
MEFAAGNERTDRKIWSNRGWTLEYAVDYTSPTGRLKESDVTERGGLRPVFALHGFARPLEDFIPTTEAWPESSAFISVHLPHHGRSGPDKPSSMAEAAIHPQELLQLFIEIAEKEGFRTDSFDLIGYSIGGRIALSLITLDPKRWRRVVLLAPDGLKQSPFYGLTVHTQLGKILWFAIDRNSDRVLRWSDRLLKWKFMGSHLHAFIAFHLSSHEMRMMVWNGWRAHRKCWPSHRAVAGAFKSVDGSIDLFFGSHDRIIPIDNGRHLRNMTQSLSHVRFHSIPSGHGMLRQETFEMIIQRIFKT